MKDEEMTEVQRQSLDHLDRARAEGLSVKAYARAWDSGTADLR